MPESLEEIILPHLGRPDLTAAMQAFYADVDSLIAARQPVCVNRGLCCRFDSFGHRLYVTGLELIYFLHGRHGAWRSPKGLYACPYQIQGLCAARPHRPLGCRVFFCDGNSQAWQGPEYERRLAELKRLGSQLGVEYRYIEWLSALGDLDATRGAIPWGRED
jgi:Fe-S-cluster containining protein